MNFLEKRAFIGDKKLTASKATLNPNATEFVPFALRSSAATNSSTETPTKLVTTAPATPGKGILGRSESSVSNNSDEESHQYWCNQLPDDITPDFKNMGVEDTQEMTHLPFSSLSLNNVNESSRYSASMPKSWDGQIVTNDQFLTREGLSYNENIGHNFLVDVSNEQLLEDNDELNPLEFLASNFPGFAAESLADVYFTNGGDLNLTIEMLTQLELQVDGGMNPSANSKPFSPPNLNASEFPALSVAEGQNGNISPYRSSEKENTFLFQSSPSILSRGAADFASAVRKTPPQGSSIWNYDSNSSSAGTGSSRISQAGRGIYGNKLQNQGSANKAPVWLETGEAVGNMYSGLREEARDHARVRNAYFEQARQAFLIGNKALAKELSFKGQIHNMKMKEAHEKAQESIYRQRNPDMQGDGRERMIDLHGLHVSEALHVLKRELSVIRNSARSAGQRLLVYICVGTGHHTRGSRTPARLPTAVQRYLLEEGLDYSEPQLGLLRVVVY